jgi:Sap, sulfolipid-1-addressing protein
MTDATTSPTAYCSIAPGRRPCHALLAIRALSHRPNSDCSRHRSHRRSFGLRPTSDHGTAGVGAPVLIYFAMGDRSRELLDRLKNWMARNSALIMAVLLLIIGVKLIGDGISALLG